MVDAVPAVAEEALVEDEASADQEEAPAENEASAEIAGADHERDDDRETENVAVHRRNGNGQETVDGVVRKNEDQNLAIVDRNPGSVKVDRENAKGENEEAVVKSVKALRFENDLRHHH